MNKYTIVYTIITLLLIIPISDALIVDPVNSNNYTTQNYDVFFGGESYASTSIVRNNVLYLFVGDGGSVRKYNFSGITNLSDVDWQDTSVNQNYSIIPTGSTVKDIIIDGNTLYVLGTIGLTSVDITNITHPNVLDTISTIDSRDDYTDMSIYGTVAYLSTGWEGVHRINISNPLSLVALSSFYVNPGNITDCVYTKGNYAYVCLRGETYYANDSLAIFDVSGTPTQIGSWIPGFYENSLSDVVLSSDNNTAYVAWWRNETYTLNITDKTNPILLNTTSGLDTAKLFINTTEGRLYVSERYQTMSIYDISGSNATAPVKLASNDTSMGYTRGITIIYGYNGKNYSVINTESIGANIIDITNINSMIKLLPSGANSSLAMSPTIPALGGSYVILQKNNDTIYSLGRNEYGWQLNITNTSNISIVNALDYGKRVEAAKISDDGNYIYWASNTEFGVINITGNTMTTESVNGSIDAEMVLETNGTYVYTMDTARAQSGASTENNVWFLTIDVSNPKNPTNVSAWNTTVSYYNPVSPSEMKWYNSTTLAISSGYNNKGIKFFDMTNPLAPVEIATIAGNIKTFAFNGTKLYAANDSYYILQYNVTNLNTAQLTSTLYLYDILASTAHIANNVLYLTWTNKAKVSKVNIASTSAMSLIETIDTGYGEMFDYTTPADITSNVFVAGGGKNALYVFNLSASPESPVGISSIVSIILSQTAATITWVTDVLSDSIVKYGTVSGSYTSNATNATSDIVHSISLTNLTASTTYYYVVNSTSGSLTGQSSEYTFTTNSLSDQGYLNYDTALSSNITTSPSFYTLGASYDDFDRPSNDDINGLTNKSKWTDESTYLKITSGSYNITQNDATDFDNDYGSGTPNISFEINTTYGISGYYNVYFNCQERTTSNCMRIRLRNDYRGAYYFNTTGGNLSDYQFNGGLAAIYGKGTIITVDTSTVSTGLKIYANETLLTTFLPDSTWTSGYVGLGGEDQPTMFGLWSVRNQNANNGLLVSNINNAGAGQIYKNITISGSIPSGTALSGLDINTSNDSITWSGWSRIEDTPTLTTYTVSEARYLVYRVNLTSTLTHKTPVVNILLSSTNEGTSIPPSPTSLSNTSGNFWINHTWSPGSGNTTNSYNVSVNGTWTNGSTNTFSNVTVSPHGWVNITIYAYNNTGVMNQTPATMNTQIPNNPPIQSPIDETLTINETQYMNITITSTDLDSDSLTYATNRSDLFTQSGNNFSWLTDYTDSGTYYVTFNTTDNYSAIDSETIIITVNATKDIPEINSNLNNITSDSDISFSVNINTMVLFSAGANQSITNWTWGTATQNGGNGTTNTTAYKLFNTAGAGQTVTVSGTNDNGTTSTLTWTVNVLSGSSGGGGGGSRTTPRPTPKLTPTPTPSGFSSTSTTPTPTSYQDIFIPMFTSISELPDAIINNDDVQQPILLIIAALIISVSSLLYRIKRK